jgi:hypothetical protein
VTVPQNIDRYLNDIEVMEIQKIRGKAFARVVMETALAMKPFVTSGDGLATLDNLKALAEQFAATVKNPRAF